MALSGAGTWAGDEGAPPAGADEAEQLAIRRAFRAMRRANVVALVIDGVEGPVEQDYNIAERAIAEGCALLVVVKKERLTAENAAVCEFVHCVLGDGALQKYGVMVMTHSSDATAALKQALEALPAENYGARMLGLVGGRLLSCEERAWRQGAHQQAAPR